MWESGRRCWKIMMAVEAAAPERAATVLILAPTGRDSQNVNQLLSKHGLPSRICNDLPALVEQLTDEAGVVLITEEALLRADTAPLAAALEAQPAWSDLPF